MKKNRQTREIEVKGKKTNKGRRMGALKIICKREIKRVGINQIKREEKRVIRDIRELKVKTRGRKMKEQQKERNQRRNKGNKRLYIM